MTCRDPARTAARTPGRPATTPSPGCNALTATLSNTLLGLPLEVGESTVSYDATLTFGRVS